MYRRPYYKKPDIFDMISFVFFSMFWLFIISGLFTVAITDINGPWGEEYGNWRYPLAIVVGILFIFTIYVLIVVPIEDIIGYASNDFSAAVNYIIPPIVFGVYIGGFIWYFQKGSFIEWGGLGALIGIISAFIRGLPALIENRRSRRLIKKSQRRESQKNQEIELAHIIEEKKFSE